MAAAVGEAAERDCAYQWDPQKTFVARWGQLNMPSVSPAECVLYSDRQYAIPHWPYHRWD